MVSILRDSAIPQQNDPIGHAYGGKTMRDEEGRLTFREFCKAREHLIFAAGIERSGWFIKDENLSVSQVSASQRKSLPLATGDIHAFVKAPPEHLFITREAWR